MGFSLFLVAFLRKSLLKWGQLVLDDYSRSSPFPGDCSQKYTTTMTLFPRIVRDSEGNIGKKLLKRFGEKHSCSLDHGHHPVTGSR
jgi:hypothetical protein